VYKDDAGQDQPVKTPLDWGIRRMHILEHAQRAMGELPTPEMRVPLDVKVESEEETPDYVRRKITFAALSEKVAVGSRVPAYLLIPKNLKGRAPAMLCLHQTTAIGKGEPAGLGASKNLRYAHELASRGYVCIVPDYPSFGDYTIDFKAKPSPFVSGTMRAIWNNMRAIDVLETLPQVDPDRIGCIGHSLGGHNTIFTAAFDQRIKAMVSSCGFNAFHHYYGGNLAGWTSHRYMPRIRDLYGNSPDKVPFDFYELVAALAPRAFYINAPLRDSNFEVEGVRKVVAEAGKVYALYGAGEKLKAAYPDAQHDFPEEQRREAYEFLDRQLKR
jgi:dienelactone hydrolase